MLFSKSRRAFSAVAATFIAIAISAAPAQATTGYGSASTISRGGFDSAVLGETDSSSVVVAGLDRSISDGDSVTLVANESSSNSTGASSNTTSAIFSTSTSRSTMNGVPVANTISMTVNGAPVTMHNITTSDSNSTSVSISTSTRCSSSSGCTTTTTTGSPSAAGAAVTQLVEERNSSGASSGEGVPAPVLTPTPVSIAPSTPETPALLPDAVRAVAK